MGRTPIANWLLALACAAASVPAAAADAPVPSSLPRLFGTFTPKAGVWSEYNLTEKDSGRKTRMKMSIVGQEGNSYWYEVTNDDGTSRNVIKMLVKGNPNDPDNIERQIIKSGDSPAMEMARDFVVMGRKMAALMFEKRSGVPASGSDAVRVEEVGEREIKVPAGTFKTKQQRIVSSDGRVLATNDYNADVLPFGVVASDTESTAMELVGFGSDAKSAITEEPLPMTAPRGMPMGMPRGMPPGMEKPGPKQ